VELGRGLREPKLKILVRGQKGGRNGRRFRIQREGGLRNLIGKQQRQFVGKL